MTKNTTLDVGFSGQCSEQVCQLWTKGARRAGGGTKNENVAFKTKLERNGKVKKQFRLLVCQFWLQLFFSSKFECNFSNAQLVWWQLWVFCRKPTFSAGRIWDIGNSINNILSSLKIILIHGNDNLFHSYQCRNLGAKSAFMNRQKKQWTHNIGHNHIQPTHHSTFPLIREKFNGIFCMHKGLLRIFCHIAQKLPVKDTFLGPRGPLVGPPIPAHPPTRANFSWVHR